MKRLCVFCGSSPGFDSIHADAARELGTALARNGIGLVYGGGSVGLMGIVADAALLEGGEVIGVMPQALVDRELAHNGCNQFHITASMHERKAIMADLSDGFIALSGGIGTFEEMFEIWTWAQLGDHGKPVSLLNIGGFYDSLAAFLDGVVAQGFLRQEHRDMLLVEDEVDALLTRLADYQPPDLGKWIGHKER
ncbi:TIGR00730 family Rossman fold protein [Sphingomonas oleivorans]|uniref:Cytokinin riboside 5'-monophosphate phosphoribohydrolase n=1 Tax=Sphingomonas oleivorans TaxID=1735121 RepID=A0A2T5G2P3_9SPHN|nr:TIGR00730 family Rossman fold protein [Sphingomonas oleivorans]PTQ13412.1 TIGR00730 family Rossman fold protein [Sphingomonas oleivorans]